MTKLSDTPFLNGPATSLSEAASSVRAGLSLVLILLVIIISRGRGGGEARVF